MRIIAGKAGRTPIKVPPAVTRPTTDFVRQAIFSILGEIVVDARALDLFCGSGAIGLEALSRGAKTCTFVDENRQAVRTVSENLKKADLEGGQIITAEVGAFLARDQNSYDLIFADPPYWNHYGDVDHAGKLLALPTLPERLAEGGYLIVEISSAQPTPPAPHFQLFTRREYGSSCILIFSHPES